MEFPNLILTLFLMFVSLAIRECSTISADGKCKAKEFPSLVSLATSFGPFCGGTILDKLHIVSAAHCFPKDIFPNSISVTAGDIRIDSQASDSRQRVEFQKIVIHPNYNNKTNENDIAISLLSEPLKINSETVNVAHLNLQSPKIGTKAIVVGWEITKKSGWTRVCRVAEVTVFVRERCEMKSSRQNRNIPGEIEAADNATLHNQNIAIPGESQICVQDVTGISGPYMGDSGGPLYVMDKQNKLKFVGIASYVNDNDSTIAVYTDIAYYGNWIINEIGNVTNHDAKMCVVAFN